MGNEELEELWRSRLADAKLRLDYATSYAQRGSSDGGALRAQAEALAEYTRTLRTFTDLVMDGRVPKVA